MSAFWLYCITEDGQQDTGPSKVGFTSSVNKRLSSLQGGNPRKLVVAWQIPMESRSQGFDVESYCLRRFRPNPYSTRDTRDRLLSEWVDASPPNIKDAAEQWLEATWVNV